MRIFRQFIGDVSSSGPLAVLVAVLFALQALIGGFGTGAMAQASAQQEIICSSHGAEQDGQGAPGEKRGMDCCLTACQIAASLHAGIPPKAPVATPVTSVWSIHAPAAAAFSVPPRHLGLSRDARGPPALSA